MSLSADGPQKTAFSAKIGGSTEGSDRRCVVTKSSLMVPRLHCFAAVGPKRNYKLRGRNYVIFKSSKREDGCHPEVRPRIRERSRCSRFASIEGKPPAKRKHCCICGAYRAHHTRSKQGRFMGNVPSPRSACGMFDEICGPQSAWMIFRKRLMRFSEVDSRSV